MTLSKKLYGTVGATAAVGLLVAVSGIAYLRELGEELRNATESTAVKLDLVNAARARAWEMVASLQGVYVSASLKNQKELDAGEKRWRSAYKRAQEQIDQLRPLFDSRETADLEKYQSSLRAFGQVSTDYISVCKEQKFEQLAGLMPGVQRFASLSDDTLNDLKIVQRNKLKAVQIRSETLRSRSLSVSLCLSGVLLVIVVLAVFGTRSICRTMTVAIGELSNGAEQVAGAAGQVSSSSQSLAQGASQQAASLAQTLASSERIDSLAHRNSENSRGAAGLVTESQEKFQQTNQSLDEMVAAMGEISTQSEKISRIIKSIDEIAFQTNILALNAAVEAARAGEAGLGFAVVADEVRNLAQRCAQAANDTTALIEESIAKSNGGKSRVDQVAVAIRAVTDDCVRVKKLVDEVHSGSLEQARGTGEIGKAILQMQQLTQTTAADAAESAAAAEELSEQSTTLQQTVRNLTVMVGGSAPAIRPGSMARQAAAVHPRGIHSIPSEVV